MPSPRADGSRGVADPARLPHRWRTLLTLTGVVVVDGTEGSIVSVLFPTIARSLGLTSGHLGVLAAAGKIASVPCGSAWVWLAARTSRRTALVFSTVVAGVFGIAGGFAQDFVGLLILHTMMSAALIGSQPIANALIADLFVDHGRSRAVGIFYGFVILIGSMISPLIAQFSNLTDGWRWGMGVLGLLCIVGSVAILLFLTDPGVGASERLATGSRRRLPTRPTVRSVLALFRIPTYSIMMVSRMLSGHLLIGVFGVQFLVSERGFDNATAAIVLLPFGAGYCVGAVGGGAIVGVLDRVFPWRGRVAFIQAAQLFFAAAAYFGTQVSYVGLGAYAACWALMGVGQGANPAVNRPIVMSVVLPELRGQAFAIMITVFEAMGWALFSVGAGALASIVGLQSVLFWVLVVLMLVNALVLGALHVTYPRDVRRVRGLMEERPAWLNGVGQKES